MILYDPVLFFQAASLVVPYLLVRYPSKSKNFNVGSEEKLKNSTPNFYESAIERITGNIGNDLVQEYLKKDDFEKKKEDIGAKLDIDVNNISKMKIPDLKAFLSSHGLRKGGSKPSLITRVQNYIESLAIKGDDPLSDSSSCSSVAEDDAELETADPKVMISETPVSKGKYSLELQPN